MSDHQQGPGWWQASDGKWYPPQSGWSPGYQLPKVPRAPRQPKTMFERMAIGWAIGTLIGMTLIGAVLWWALSQSPKG